MGFYLLENENPNATLRENSKKGYYYPRRSRDIQGIVVHTAEGGKEALGIAKYFAKTDTPASAHVVADDKQIINLLPDDYTAFHTRGSNSNSLGLELSYFASDWGTDKEYEDAVIAMAAKWCAEKVELYNITPRRLTREDWLAGKSGFISPAELDPARETVPGMNFPWEQFFTLIKGKAYRKAKRQAPKWQGKVFYLEAPFMNGADIEQWQDAAGGLTVDGIYGRKSSKRSMEIQKKSGLVQDGMVGPQTWYATFGIVEE